jgi:hypothetical protein
MYHLNGKLQRIFGFVILGNGAYLDSYRSKAKYTFDAGQSLMTFQGGSREGQAAKLEIVQGKPALHILDEKRTRTALECEFESQ